MPLRRMGPPLGTFVWVDDCDDSLPLSMMICFLTLMIRLNASLAGDEIRDDGFQSPPVLG